MHAHATRPAEQHKHEDLHTGVCASQHVVHVVGDGEVLPDAPYQTGHKTVLYQLMMHVVCCHFPCDSVHWFPHQAKTCHLHLMWSKQPSWRKVQCHLRQWLHCWERRVTVRRLWCHWQLGSGDGQLHADW